MLIVGIGAGPVNTIMLQRVYSHDEQHGERDAVQRAIQYTDGNQRCEQDRVRKLMVKMAEPIPQAIGFEVTKAYLVEIDLDGLTSLIAN